MTAQSSPPEGPHEPRRQPRPWPPLRPFSVPAPSPTSLIIGGIEPVVSDLSPLQLSVSGVFQGPFGRHRLRAWHGLLHHRAADALGERWARDPLSGNALITVVNQGVTAAIPVRVQLGDDDGDGLMIGRRSTAWIRGPTDALVDQDADSLTNEAVFSGCDPGRQPGTP